MSDDRYARAKNIVLGARSLPEAIRAAFVERACGGDAELRAEVDSLLGYEAVTPRVIEPGALDRAIEDALEERGPVSPPAPPAPAGMPERIGPYRILGVLGEGGMGVVYRAEQTEPIRREVALKLIRRGLDTERVVARFEVERQALALMDHPNIARVLDAGTDQHGRPYFVMELVEGSPITEFCDRHRLSVRERIELFLRVCEAVQHAHRRGIIHRDLKPSNVLVAGVDGRPFPKIIDFGVAKAVENPLTPDGMETLEGILVGTPEYMSPEQAGAGARVVDTRSDVYSLGVLLFELLTGARPYRLANRPLAEVPHAILTEEPTRPSTAVRRGGATPIAAGRRTTLARLSRELHGDLDQIVLMALRKEPDRRYSSVEHLAADLRRHGAGLPVAARRGSWRYRSGKFVRRHALALGLAAAAFVWLGVLAATLATQSARVTRERDRARAAEADAKRETDTAKQVSDFLVELFEGASPDESRGADVTVRDMLGRGTARARAELAGQPVVLGRFLSTIGDVYHALGHYEEADSILREALAVRERALGPRAPDVASTLDLLGTVAHDRGELDACLVYNQRALDIRTAAFGDSSAATAQSVRNLAVAYQAKMDLAAAEPLFRRALAVDRRALGEENAEVAWDKNSLAWLLYQKGDYAGAGPLYEDALATQRRLLGERHPDVAGTLNNLAGLRWRLGDFAAAESLWREALDVYRALYPDGHAAVSRAEYNVARVLRSEGKLDEAERYYRDGLAMARRVVGEEHPFYAGHLYGLGVVLTDEGRTDEAAPLLARSLAIRRRVYGEVHPTYAEGLMAMGDLELARKHAWSAERCFTQARSILERRLPADQVDQANPLLGLARAALLRGDVATAAPLAGRAVEIRAAALGNSHPLTVEARAVLERCASTGVAAAPK